MYSFSQAFLLSPSWFISSFPKEIRNNRSFPRLKKGTSLSHETKKGYTSFCYLISGKGEFNDTKLEQAHVILFTEAGSIAVKAIEDINYIFVTGRQLKEPITWGGPIVMNTQQELETAFRELDEGTFIKKK